MIEPNTIVCGDCLEILKGMPDKSVDCIISDPPYGVGKEFANDSETPIELLIEVFSELWRVAKDKR